MACGGSDKPAEHPPEHSAEKPPEKPPAEPTSSASATVDRSALHAALVDTHKKIVKECFGGFGKGVPYSAELTVSGTSVTDASVATTVESKVDLPRKCMAEKFKATSLPAGTTTPVKARFAVKNPNCTEPECNKDDLQCTFARDVRCSVIVD